MTSFLRSWLSSQAPTTSADVPSIVEASPVLNTDDDDETVHGGDDAPTDDAPPAFPSLNSAQRVGASKPARTDNALPRVLTDAQLMPPPPVPSLASRSLGVPAVSGAGSLAVPPSTHKPPASAKRLKVALAPGHGPLDWANLKRSGQDLRGVDTLLRVTPAMLKEHRTREDAWSAFNGKVYNITPYLPYHPGGEKELMRVAGRDGSKLFALTHAWVNLDYMLDACLVGFLVPE
ncbi:cytochrome b5 [Obba rivulosa]|uniref:Cytochrome b5 n=1 Tax=Obba rivulosa TaxID=1052685 RepID=A0A8E2DED6_9APHY|nr:cytochrome b5 [Obba rivulosa]